MSESNRPGGHHDRARGLIRWPRVYDLLVKAMTLGREDRLRDRIVALGRVEAGEAVLDVGCGTGTLLRAVARGAPGVARLCGIDPAAEMVAHARRLATREGVTVEVNQAFADALPFDDSTFDVVFCTLVIHHLPPSTTAAALREMRRVLRPGGRLVVADFKRGHHRPLGTRLHDKIGRLFHPRRASPVAPFGTASLEEAGFESVEEGDLGRRAIGAWTAVAPVPTS